MSVIEVRNVLMNYEQRTIKNSDQPSILNGLNLSVKFGSIYALIGASACGKTTLLTCLLGMHKIDSGEMKIFYQKVEFNKPSKFAKLIGYMPQETALVPQLTIIEMLQFFSHLYEMSKTKFNERFKMISDLLELPSKHLLIDKLSGGEQRRISLAVSIIHDPKILFLDEPTVGLDFELRDKIWKFLHQQSSEMNLTVLITTHYSCEAAKAHRCGFMRNGVLIADDKPKDILERLNVETLDEAFYQLSLNECDYKSRSIKEKESKVNLELLNSKKKRLIRFQVIKGLLIKEYHRIRRQPLELFVIFLLPFLQILLYMHTIGFIPNNLKLGIINEEVQECSTISNSSQNCSSQKFSCQFLNHIDSLEKVKYKSFDDGYKDIENGKLIGLLTIPTNFSKSLLNTRPKNPQFTKFISNYLKNNRGNFQFNSNLTKSALKHHFNETSLLNIEVILDFSKYPFHLCTQLKILTSFFNFIDELSKECNVREQLTLKPIRFEEEMFGPMNFDIKISKLPYLIILNPIYAVYIYALFTILQCRSEGVWNRSILSGMKLSEIFITLLIQGNIMAALLSFEAIFLVSFVLKVQTVASFWIIFGIIFRTTYVGFLIGLISSIVFDNITVVNQFGQMICVLLMFSSGLLWPHEGMSTLIKIISHLTPVSSSSIALVNAFFKQSDIFDIVKHSNIVLYEVIFTVICFWLMQHKKFFKTQ